MKSFRKFLGRLHITQLFLKGGVVVVVVVVTPNFFTVGGEGAQEGDEEGKAEK